VQIRANPLINEVNYYTLKILFSISSINLKTYNELICNIICGSDINRKNLIFFLKMNKKSNSHFFFEKNVIINTFLKYVY
jgi:hypothetical protein